MHVQLAYFLLSTNREKIKFGGIQVLWDYHTKGDTAEESTFCITIGLCQLTWNRYKFPQRHAVSYSPVNKPLFHGWSQNPKLVTWNYLLIYYISARNFKYWLTNLQNYDHVTVNMAKARRRSPRKCKCTKGNAGADVINGTSSTDVDAKAKDAGRNDNSWVWKKKCCTADSYVVESICLSTSSTSLRQSPLLWQFLATVF